MVKLRGRYRDFSYTLCSHTGTTSPIINIHQPQSGTLVLTDDPPLTHNHPIYIVSIRVHSWSGTFCEFRQMYTNMYPPLWCYTDGIFTALEILCGPPIHPCALELPWDYQQIVEQWFMRWKTFMGNTVTLLSPPFLPIQENIPEHWYDDRNNFRYHDRYGIVIGKVLNQV